MKILGTLSSLLMSGILCMFALETRRWSDLNIEGYFCILYSGIFFLTALFFIYLEIKSNGRKAIK